MKWIKRTPRPPVPPARLDSLPVEPVEPVPPPRWDSLPVEPVEPVFDTNGVKLREGGIYPDLAYGPNIEPDIGLWRYMYLVEFGA